MSFAQSAAIKVEEDPEWTAQTFTKVLSDLGIWPVTIQGQGAAWYRLVKEAVDSELCTFESFISVITREFTNGDWIGFNKALQMAVDEFRTP